MATIFRKMSHYSTQGICIILYPNPSYFSLCILVQREKLDKDKDRGLQVPTDGATKEQQAHLEFCFDRNVSYRRGPQLQAMDHYCGSLGTRPHSRSWAAGQQAKLYLYLQSLPIVRFITWAWSPVRLTVTLD